MTLDKLVCHLLRAYLRLLNFADITPAVEVLFAGLHPESARKSQTLEEMGDEDNTLASARLKDPDGGATHQPFDE